MDSLTRSQKRRQTLIKKFGSEEAYIAHMKSAGSKGGKKTGDSKVRGDREFYRKLGKKGGSSRGK